MFFTISLVLLSIVIENPWAIVTSMSLFFLLYQKWWLIFTVFPSLTLEREWHLQPLLFSFSLKSFLSGRYMDHSDLCGRIIPLHITAVFQKQFWIHHGWGGGKRSRWAERDCLNIIRIVIPPFPALTFIITTLRMAVKNNDASLFIIDETSDLRYTENDLHI